MLASRDGHTNIAQLLLEDGADANLQGKVSSSAKIVCECIPCCCALGTAHITGFDCVLKSLRFREFKVIVNLTLRLFGT